MARKKKTFDDVNEVIEPMKDDAMNPPEEDRAEDVGVVDDAIKEKEEVVDPINDPIKVSSEPKKMRIKSTSSLVNVRENPDGEILFRIQNGTPIIVTEEVDGWCKIEGWVMKALVGER